MNKPLRTLTFTHADRNWIAREWPNSDLGAPTLWNLAPEDQTGGMPSHQEYREARAHFGAALKPPKDAA